MEKRLSNLKTSEYSSIIEEQLVLTGALGKVARHLASPSALMCSKFESDSMIHPHLTVHLTSVFLYYFADVFYVFVLESYFMTVDFQKQASSSDSTIVRIVDNIKKSDSDPWIYRGLELSNEMLVVLISHSNIDKAAAALDISIGSLADPRNVPGIAHFLEHMLFMGSSKVCHLKHLPIFKILV